MSGPEEQGCHGWVNHHLPEYPAASTIRFLLETVDGRFSSTTMIAEPSANSCHAWSQSATRKCMRIAGMMTSPS